MSDDNTQDGAEPSPASAGSQPVAWAYEASDGKIIAVSPSQKQTEWDVERWNGMVRDGMATGEAKCVPLYRQPHCNGTGDTREPLSREVGKQSREPDAQSREPLAWSVLYFDRIDTICGSKQDCERFIETQCRRDYLTVAPLYRRPQPTLTDAERKAIWTVAEAYAENDGDPECERIARIMQGLWHRTK